MPKIHFDLMGIEFDVDNLPHYLANGLPILNVTGATLRDAILANEYRVIGGIQADILAIIGIEPSPTLDDRVAELEAENESLKDVIQEIITNG